MVDARRRAILRQMVRPPYIHRWTTLIAGTYVVVVLTATGIMHAVPTPVAVAQAVPAPAAPAAPVAVPSSVLTDTFSTDRTVTLTFDDGPHPVFTPQVLAVLDEYRVPAVFCMVTRNAAKHPEITRDVLARGHVLCDHTTDHDPGLARSPAPDIAVAMRASAAELTRAAGTPDVRIPYFRAPQGMWSPDLERSAAALGMRPLGWSVDSKDWTGVPADQIMRTVRAQAHDGSIILLHDGGGDRATTVAVLRELIPWLHEAGYRFVLPDPTAAYTSRTPTGGPIPDAATGR